MSKIQINKDLSGVKALLGNDAFVIMDNNLKHLCRYFDGCRIIGIETGEQKKCMESVLPIIERLLDEGADRGSFILGVGGGITTDIAGFWLRYTNVESGSHFCPLHCLLRRMPR